MLDARRLQTNLGVPVDGIIGAGTLTALFARMGAAPAIAAELGLAANVHFRAYGILDSGLRLAHFMGQCSHESGGFRYMEEIASGAGYEGRATWETPKPATESATRGAARSSSLEEPTIAGSDDRSASTLKAGPRWLPTRRSACWSAASIGTAAS